MLEAAGFRSEAALHELLRKIERFLGVALGRFAQGIIKLPGKERLGGLSFFGNIAHPVEKVGESRLLFGKLFAEVFLLIGIAEALLLRVSHLFKLLADVFLIFRELPRIVSHLVHLFTELRRVLLAHVIAQVLKLALRARAGG